MTDKKCDECEYKKHSIAVSEWEKAQELTPEDFHQILMEGDCDCEICKPKEKEKKK